MTTKKCKKCAARAKLLSLFKRPNKKTVSSPPASFLGAASLFFKFFVTGKVGTNKNQQVLLSAPIILQSRVTDVTFRNAKYLFIKY